MERRVNYILVGIFSLVLVAGITTFVLWAHQRGGGRSLATYTVYFDQAVNGLALGSVVRFLGVDVGHVESITLDKNSPQPRVRVIAGVDSSIPINQGTIASLKPSGITGVSFIDLRNDPENTAPLAADNQPPVIRSESSGFDRLFDGASDTMQRLNMLLSNENLQHLHNTLNNLDDLSRRLNTLLGKNEKSLNQFFGELGPTVQDAHETVHSFDALSESLNKDPSQLIFR